MKKVDSLEVEVLVTQLCPTFVTPWTHQAPLSMELSMREYWYGLTLLSPGDHPDPGIEPKSPTLRADSLPTKSPGKPRFAGGGVNYITILEDNFMI